MNSDTLQRIKNREEVLWLNPKKKSYSEVESQLPLHKEDTEEASNRLERFAPVIRTLFPETRRSMGKIESRLVPIPEMQIRLYRDKGVYIRGSLFLKMDSHLPVSGSVKARGGIYEVLKIAEMIALKHCLLNSVEDDYLKLCSENGRNLFSKYTIQVGSTGNLGMVIGIMGTALGFKTIVHMSKDAKQWKVDLLKKSGVQVIVYEGDYEEAVRNGRLLSNKDSYSYFVDDENSSDLFLGYSTAGKRLKEQLDKRGIVIDDAHPLFVYLPCGVGGAPAGIGFGLKQEFGDNVHVFFAEPIVSPCMLLGLASEKKNDICVSDIGLSGQTEADGLAVGRCSKLAAEMMEYLLDGEGTMLDSELSDYLQMLFDTEDIFAEPSACAGFKAVELLFRTEDGKAYLKELQTENAVHVIWATGGNRMPINERMKYLNNLETSEEEE